MLYSRLRLGSLTDDLKLADFRKTALAITAATFAAGASLATYPAPAQQVSSNESGSSACSQIKDNLKGIRCEIDALHQRGIDADKRTEKAEAATRCMESVIVKINAAKKSAPLTREQKTGFKAQLDSCNNT